MKLYGSLASPYVRRVRMLLHAQPYEFVNMQIFEPADRARLVAKNPTLKIPMLEDGDLVLFDSRVIFRYLSEKNHCSPLSWPQENLLTLIDAINDSLVQLFILRRSGIAEQSDTLFYTAQAERISACLTAIEQAVTEGALRDWSYPAICLYSLVDWARFRELYAFERYPAICEFIHAHADRADVMATDPRNS